MELTTIEMDQDKAKEAERGYRDAVKERRQEEDAELARAYRELAKGSKLIRLSEAMVVGGTETLKVPSRHRRNTWEGEVRTQHTTVRVPKLAVCRADAKYAWTNGIDEAGDLRIQGKRSVALHNGRDVITLEGFRRGPTPTVDPPWDRNFGGSGVTCAIRAMAPIVPPPLRPAHALGNYHLLWEAEWKFHPPAPPVDPALLKHIGGDLYTVLAVWDLTDIERAVLAGREPE